MGVQLAPYNNAMRLGQGFNSYTQQICLNDAVMKPLTLPKAPETPQDESFSSQSDDVEKYGADVPARGVSQIVSYSSRFVDKLSDVTDAMNISASLSIKTATIGGSASGSFIDSDKFKESDLNFFVQVKVVNQVISGEDYTEFQNILSGPSKFTEVYGDTFISGFEEGGELNAVISVKVSDKNKTFAIKAELEASLGTPALSGQVTGGIDLNKSEVQGSTETTVTVNWSGGGQIKTTDAIWDVNTLTLAAANFPDLVAKTPQRTYAILSKYTSLKSFLKVYQPASVLSYENAGVYTSALLDTYMDYKSIWKQIQIANFELKNKRADMRAAKPSQEVVGLAEAHKVKTKATSKEKVPESSQSAENSQGIAIRAVPASETLLVKDGGSSGRQDGAIVIPDMIDFIPYTPTVMGLDKARRDCRNEMIKIVKEVDAVTGNPNLALDPRREEQFVSPRVFVQLLPIVTLKAVETSNPQSNLNPRNLVILGDSQGAPPLQQWLFNRMGNQESPQPFPAMAASLEHHKSKSNTFDMGENWAGVIDPAKTATFFNCLDRIDGSFVPKSLDIWIKDDIFIGLKVSYDNGEEIAHGECPGNATKRMEIIQGNSHSVIQLVLETAERAISDARIRGLRIMSNTCQSQEFPTLGRSVSSHKEVNQITLSQPTNGFWTFRGFWGSFAPFQGGLLVLGAVWGRDDSKSPGQPDTSSAAYEMFLGRTLPNDAIETAKQHAPKAGQFSMSNLIGDSKTILTIKDDPKMQYFNDLDRMSHDGFVKQICLYHGENAYKSALTGYSIRYTNGSTTDRGQLLGTPSQSTPGTHTAFWNALNMEGTKLERAPFVPYINYIQVVGMYEEDTVSVGSENAISVVIGPPDHTWSLAGFWGYYHRDERVITHLGAVWAKREDLT